MNILIFNWRDRKHPFSGGAEVYIHEIAKRLAKKGHKVTLFCGWFKGLSKEEEYDGLKIIRRGNKYTLYLYAFLWYILGKKDYDIIIDCENGIPFFTPLYSKKPKLMVVHHVHEEVFNVETNKYIAKILSVLETKLMSFIYRNVQIVAVSESTKKDLLRIGFKEQKIKIIKNGLNRPKFFASEKNKTPRVIYLGRIKKYKRIDLLLKAFNIVSNFIPDAELYIVGAGEKKRVNNIIYTGFVSEEDKIKLLYSAWVFVNPSLKEGWGVSVIEANACGTPCIAFDVPGLRDSIVDGKTGILVKENGNVEKLAEAIIKILKDEKLRNKLSENALKHARKFSWDKSAKEFLSILKSILE